MYGNQRLPELGLTLHEIVRADRLFTNISVFIILVIYFKWDFFGDSEVRFKFNYTDMF